MVQRPPSHVTPTGEAPSTLEPSSSIVGPEGQPQPGQLAAHVFSAASKAALSALLMPIVIALPQQLMVWLTATQSLALVQLRL